MAMYQTARPWEDLKRGAELGFFFAFHLAVTVFDHSYQYVSKKNIYIFLQNITRY
jgi:hypothetical protein